MTYGLEGLANGQAKFAHARANAFLQKVMMDTKAPTELKDFLRAQNAIGLLMMQDLLAAFHRQEDDAHRD